MARFLNRAVAVSVRDEVSRETLGRCGVHDVTVTADAAFALPVHVGLLSALAALTTETARVADVHVVRSFAPGLPALEPDVELVVYRVAQEALTNVSRHARARTVEVSLTRRGDRVVLRVVDDGRGIKGTREGSGIAGMRERARLVDAELDVRPAENGGTEVELVVPVRAQDHA